MTRVSARPADWAARISASWQKSLHAIIETGRLLAQAKSALPHGEFGDMIETALPFSASTAQRLMAISADRRITNPAHVRLLPPSWGTLYELTKLDDATFKQNIKNGLIRPDMERREVVNGHRAVMGSRIEPPDSYDFLPTPPWATRALIDVAFPKLPLNITLSGWDCWEPACGEGHIAEVLREYFGRVEVDDIHDYGYANKPRFDFLKHSEPDCVDWIITNPPFGDKAEMFVHQALRQARVGVAVFVTLRWLETIGRYERLFKDQPPTLIAFFAERVPLCKGRWDPEGDTATAYIWLVWVKGANPQPPFWIPPGQREALTRPDDVARFTAHPVIRREDVDTETGEVTEAA